MSFILYDVAFLVVFTLAVAGFLYARRKNLKREGLLYLYRTKFGLKVINSFSKKYEKILMPLQYVMVASGYALMAFMLYVLGKFSYAYLTSDIIAKSIKMPVVMPLIPYLPELFKIDYLPPFYFTYWIIIIAIIAIPHEFAHGIIAKLNKIRILSTGFGFLGPFLAAFVEQDDKQMKKAKKFSQLSVLAAGTFANVICAALFALILWLFFASAFTPAGVNFNTYAVSAVNKSDISIVSFASPETPQNFTFAMISAGNTSYFADKTMLDFMERNDTSYAVFYDNSPAFSAKLSGAIAEINGQEITSYSKLNQTLSSYSPGDNVEIKTINKDRALSSCNITLSEKNGKAFLGIGIIPPKSEGVLSKFYALLSKIKDPAVYYDSRLGDFGIFIFNLLWWIAVVSISVALMNMLPAGMFDGGRFFYLTILGITRKEKIAKAAFKAVTWILLALLALLLVKWILAVF